MVLKTKKRQTSNPKEEKEKLFPIFRSSSQRRTRKKVSEPSPKQRHTTIKEEINPINKEINPIRKRTTHNSASDERQLRSNRRSSPTAVNYTDLTTSEEDVDEYIPTRKRPRDKTSVSNSKQKRSRQSNKSRHKQKNTEDDDAFSISDVKMEENNSDDELSNFKEEEDSSFEKPKKQYPKKSITPNKKKQSKSSTKIAKPTAKSSEGGKSMAESFKPTDTPIFWKESLHEIKKNYEYLDPCGMEATDDVIDHLVGDQVRKIGGLLKRSLVDDLGSINKPLQLGTACSGTDAPALALTMVQEQMQRMPDLFTDTEFHYEHKFSCEKEPFKQSYLARNFDSVLYPDISRLAGTGETPRDVYGRATPLPNHNVFVAGTSCKNFSLLNSTKRLDIEDKGCSGETFLAAVEVLYQEQPDFCIFENVIGAPWSKMQEYVTGRVQLATVDDKNRAIKKIVAKDAKIKHLTFELSSDGSIVVVEVPMHVGVRCGSVVRGFITTGKNKIIPAQWPSNKKKSQSKCTLTELLQANPKIKSSTDTLVLDTPCTYCTCVQKVDTKMYGLPQTRERTYMFVWKTSGEVEDDLGVYWQALVQHLASPVQHSLEAFILDTDHDNIRVFREALNGPPGRHTKRSVFQAIDFWTSGDANLKHNVIARDRLGIEDMARNNVRWGPRGKKQVPPHYWLEYVDCHQQRELDALEILHSSAARDAETHDSNFSSFFWNISQNVSKEKHRTKIPGIASCISPGGEFFVTHLGRPLLGCEKLLVQGIPYFRLALGSESEVELGDLAGNAMSLTVVCATLLAIMTCHQLRSEHPDKSLEQLLTILDEKFKSSKNHKNGSVVIPTQIPSISSMSMAEPIFQTLANLAPEAVESSVWCTCETSGRNSSSIKFFHCSKCRISCCSQCIGSHTGYQMESHDLQEIKLDNHHMGSFLSKLRNAAPASLLFDEKGITFLANLNDEDIYRVLDLYKFVFNLQKIQRQRRKWVLHYNARDDNGVGEVVASFRITIGELWTQSVMNGNKADLGMKGELISYLPAKTPPLVTGQLEPCAIVIVPQGHKQNKLKWQALGKPKKFSLEILGEDPEPSLRVELGLTDKAAKNLENASLRGAQKKHFHAAKTRGEERRWMYPDNWKEWPKILTIKSSSLERINGSYKRAPCRQTANQSAIWIHENKNSRPLYLIIKPNIGRTGPDTAVISTSISHTDYSAILVTLSSTWQPCDALVKGHVKQKGEQVIWTDASMKCSVPDSTIQVDIQSPPETFLAIRALSESQMNMLYPFERKSSSKDDFIRLNVHNGSEAQKIIRPFNYLCVPAIMREAAIHFSQELSPEAKWNILKPKKGQSRFGFCEEVIPSRPMEDWVFDEERGVWTRRSTPEESRKFYVQLQNAKTAFDFTLNKKKGTLDIQCNPEVGCHHAARFLLDGRGDLSKANGMVVSYRLSDISLQSDPECSPFKVFPCTKESPTAVTLKAPYCLYERQQKVVTKMALIESGDVSYEELEMAEHEMPGSTGFSLIAKASRKRTISGGVIADAIGAGKTVISIALILQGLKKARASRAYPNNSGASLVIVPSALVQQWESEIDKFTNGLKVLCIHDTSKLKFTTVRQIIEADVVIFPIDIVESKGYTENLASKSGLKKEGIDIPELPKSMGHAEKPGAKGVWIPASSRDPFGIGSGNEMKNQRLRELSAFFTHSYLKAVHKLREKTYRESDRGIPLEYFVWDRIFVDEIHEALTTEKDSLELDWFKEKNRRASRELLGIAQKDLMQRPLVYRRSIFGLTGTPLLDNSNRVIELANLIGCTYIIGLASHWRKLERESRRDIFLQHFLEPKQSREIRKAIYYKCQDYLETSCCRNTTEKELEGMVKTEKIISVQMTKSEVKDYLNSQSGIDRDKRGLGVRPENFDPSAGHDISKFLRQNADSPSRGKALVETCKSILSKEPTTKIIVFTDGRIGAGQSAIRYLNKVDGLGCTWLSMDDSVETQNKKISFYQRADVTDEDRNRPRVLVLHFDHAAGLNLQRECNNLILYSPLYVGDGGITGDPVSDASTEQQAIGRVFRPGQLRPEVFVYRIELQGPKGEECLDGALIRRNTDEQTLNATTNAG